MGVVAKQFAKQSTKRLIEPMTVPIGPWVDEACSKFPFLQRDEILNLRSLKTLFAIQVQYAQTSTLNVQGKARKSQINAASLQSLLRCEGGRKDGDCFTLGACSNHSNQFFADWTLLIHVDSPASARLAVTNCRTLDNNVPNADLLKEVRAAVAAGLLEAPNLALVEGIPDLNELITRGDLGRRSRGQHRSPFSNDFFLPMPASFHDGASIELPAGGAGKCATWLERMHWPAMDQSDVVFVADLSGGRPVDSSTLSCISGGFHDVLQLSLPNLASASPVGKQRTFRAAMRLLRRIALAADKDNESEIGSPITAFVDDCLTLWSQTPRNQHFEAVWKSDQDTDLVSLGKGRSMPVALHIDCADSVSLLDELMTAQAWLTVRERTWTKGLRVESQKANRQYTSRRPMFLEHEDKLLPYLRYVQTPDNRPDVVLRGKNAASWFWECKVRSKRNDGRVEGVLLVDALSQTEGVLGYGAELLTVFRSLAWKIGNADPSAEFQTVTLDLG
jgi:hypothetical protein